jgi:tRNA pseudouridine38-40 synthase
VHNIKLILAYVGTVFSGYELQPGKKTIRGEIEQALKKIFKQKISIISSSRTDAGVHALQNIINFKTDQTIPIARIPVAMNSILPDDIRVLKAEEKGDSFNSRFDAKNKEYEYLIYNGEILPPVLRSLVWHVKPKLNLSTMRKAAKVLIGKHDFSSFCASGGDDKDFVRIIHSFGIRHSTFGIWDGQKIGVIRIKVKGNGFLYKMVRNMVGTLVEVGLGRLKVQDVRRILLAKNRRLAGRTAPAQGLCLLKVNY